MSKSIVLDNIKVGYLNYDINQVNHEYAEDNDFVGITDYQKQVIKIKESLSKNELVNTVLHEILHCCNFYFGMKEHTGSKLEEKFVDCMANGLTTILRDNLEILDWLKENIEK